MKNLNKAIIIALGMALPLSVMASPGDDVTIRMMDMNEHAADTVTSHIELPGTADDHAREHAANGLETANNGSNGDMDRENDHESDNGSSDHDMDRETEHEREMDREDEHERDMTSERDDRKDVEHDGVDRAEVEHGGIDNIDHSGDNTSGAAFDAPGADISGGGIDSSTVGGTSGGTVGGTGRDIDPSSRGPR